MVMLSTNVHDCALAFEGGGYRASYTAGFANMLLRHGVYFDFVCGISAGSSHTVDYASRDEWRVRAGFIELSDRRPQAGGLGSLLRGNGYFNADYDYLGCVEDGYMPFDWDTFAANPVRLRIQSFAAETGASVRYTKRDMVDIPSMMERVRASSTLPVVMKPPVIDGLTMYDGGLGEGGGIPTHLAEEAGFDRVVLVLTRPKGYRKEAPRPRDLVLYRRIAKDNELLYQALATRHERYNVALAHAEMLEREGRAYVFRPTTMPVTSMTLDRAKLEASYAAGLEQAEEEWPAVEKFIFG